MATTSGYGPRFLHSTGQLHKGGGDNGVFLRLTGGLHEWNREPEKTDRFVAANPEKNITATRTLAELVAALEIFDSSQECESFSIPQGNVYN